MEIEVRPDVVKFIERKSKELGLTFNQTANYLIRQQFEIEKDKCMETCSQKIYDKDKERLEVREIYYRQKARNKGRNFFPEE